VKTLNIVLFRNRDAEAELMKDVEGWEVGTWYGHKIYKVLNIFHTHLDFIIKDLYAFFLIIWLSPKQAQLIPCSQKLRRYNSTSWLSITG
jgi:hypothetical protein